MISRQFFLGCAAVSTVALLGCPNAEGEFEAFQERYETIHPPTTSGGGGGTSCSGVPKAGEADGDFIFAFSASLDPKSPVLFDTKLTTKDGASGLEMSLTVQALDTCDRKTKVGTPFELGPFPVAADGSFEAKFPPLEVTGLANPFSENAITAEVTLLGNLCAPAETICGELEGDVTKPTTIALAGSTFRLDRLESAGSYPTEIKVDCAGTAANTKLPSKCTK